MFPVGLINPPVFYQVNQESSTENVYYSGTNEQEGRHLKEVFVSRFVELLLFDVERLQSLVLTGIDVFLILNQLTFEFSHSLFELAVLLRRQAPWKLLK